MWMALVPVEMGASELSQTLGLGVGVGKNSRLASVLDRVVRYGLAEPAREGVGLDVYRQVGPLSPRQLSRLPEWTRDTHERLFGAHLEQVDDMRSEEHTSELQSLMRISYAVFC